MYDARSGDIYLKFILCNKCTYQRGISNIVSGDDNQAIILCSHIFGIIKTYNYYSKGIFTVKNRNQVVRKICTCFEQPPSIKQSVFKRETKLSSCHLVFIKTEYRKPYFACKSCFAFSGSTPVTTLKTSITNGMLVSISFHKVANEKNFITPYGSSRLVCNTEPLFLWQRLWQEFCRSIAISFIIISTMPGQFFITTSANTAASFVFAAAVIISVRPVVIVEDIVDVSDATRFVSGSEHASFPK